MFVHTKKEYAKVVWYPNYSWYNTRIKSIQKRFLWFIFRKFGFLQRQWTSYEFKLQIMNIDSLSNRRCNASLVFVLINNWINGPHLLFLLNFFAQPRTLRSGRDFLFRIPFHRYKYGALEPMNNTYMCVLLVNLIIYLIT